MTLRTLNYGNYGIFLINYGNYGIFLIMGNAGFCPSTVVCDPAEVPRIQALRFAVQGFVYSGALGL